MERAESLDSLKSMVAHRKKYGQKFTLFHIEDKIKNSLKSKTTKMIMDFNFLDSASIQSFTIEKKRQRKIKNKIFIR